MPRLARKLLPSAGTYHVTARGVARSSIVRDEDDARLFLALLAKHIRQERWDCHAFCLMPNHYHAILDAKLDCLPHGFHRLNGVYAQTFNECYARSGRNATEYVLANPVRAILCTRPEDRPWSGTRRGLSSDDG